MAHSALHSLDRPPASPVLSFDADARRGERRGHRALRQEMLPFTVEPVGAEAALAAAVNVRQQAYARHLPEFSDSLVEPEAADFEGVVLLASSKLDGSALGSMRIQSNAHKPLPLEASVTLPPEIAGCRLAEATRLGVARGQEGSLVKTALFKAFYLYCVSHGIEYMVVAGRSPVDRQYMRLMFEDLFPGRGFVPLRHAGNLPHRVMALDLTLAAARWREARHPLLDFICNVEHPDIHVEGAMPWQRMSHHGAPVRDRRAAAAGRSSLGLAQA
jgi:hypothetical protein